MHPDLVQHAGVTDRKITAIMELYQHNDSIHVVRINRYHHRYEFLYLFPKPLPVKFLTLGIAAELVSMIPPRKEL